MHTGLQHGIAAEDIHHKNGHYCNLLVLPAGGGSGDRPMNLAHGLLPLAAQPDQVPLLHLPLHSAYHCNLMPGGEEPQQGMEQSGNECGQPARRCKEYPRFCTAMQQVVTHAQHLRDQLYG